MQVQFAHTKAERRENSREGRDVAQHLKALERAKYRVNRIMDLKTILLNWPADNDATEAFCLVGTEPGLDKCFRFEVTTNGTMQATLHITPGTYEVKVLLTF